MLLVIEVRSGPSGHRKIWLRPGQAVHVGRTDAADFTLAEDVRLSGQHFLIEYGTNGCRIRDLKSRNGTFVNGGRIEAADLKDGDAIRAGRTTFTVRIEPDPGQLSSPTGTIASSFEAPEKHAAAPGPAPVPALPVSALSPPRPEARDASPSARATGPNLLKRVAVELQSSRGRQRRVWLHPGECLTIGRTDAADLALPEDERLSGRHFVLEADQHACHVRDLESTNGTFLNGVRILSATLRDGDTVVAGKTTFAIHLEGGSPAPERHIELAPPAADRGVAGGQTVPPVGTNRGAESFCCAKYPCRSSLWLFRGTATRFDASAVCGRLTLLGRAFLVGDVALLGVPTSAPTLDESAAQPDDAGNAGPAVVGPLKAPELKTIFEKVWGQDAAVCVFSPRSQRELEAHFQRVARGEPPFDAARYDPDLACMRPKALADFLVNAEPPVASAFMAGIDVVLLEVHGGERWAILAPPRSGDVLLQLGFELLRQ